MNDALSLIMMHAHFLLLLMLLLLRHACFYLLLLVHTQQQPTQRCSLSHLDHVLTPIPEPPLLVLLRFCMPVYCMPLACHCLLLLCVCILKPLPLPSLRLLLG
jgi:hypothetical protein